MRCVIVLFGLTLLSSFALGQDIKLTCTNDSASLSVEFNKKIARVSLDQQNIESLFFISRSDLLSYQTGSQVSHLVYQGGWNHDYETRSHLNIVLESSSGKIIDIQHITENPNGIDEYILFSTEDCIGSSKTQE